MTSCFLAFSPCTATTPTYSNAATPFVSTDFIDRIDSKWQREYQTLCSHPFEAGLSFWGDVTVRVNGSPDLSIKSFTSIIALSIRAEIKESISINRFELLSSKPLYETAKRVSMLMAAQTSLEQACLQYRQGRWYRYCGQSQRNHFETQWNQALSELQGTIAYVLKPPRIVEQLNQNERVTQTIYTVLAGIKQRYTEHQFSHQDQQQLQKCKDTAQHMQSDIKINSTWISHQTGAEYAQSLQTSSTRLCQYIAEIEYIHDVISLHVAKRLAAIAHASATPTDFTLIVGENSIQVHRQVFLRTAPNFFERAMNGTWKETTQAGLELSDTFTWSTVVEYISWMYGISSINQVPPFLTKRFTEAAEFFMAGEPLPNKLERFT